MRYVIALSTLCLALSTNSQSAEPDTLPGTKPLTVEGDIAAQMVAGIDKFLLRKIDESVEQREQYWKRDFSSPEAYDKSIEPNRQRLAKMLGVVDDRLVFKSPDYLAKLNHPSLVGGSDSFDAHRVRWPVLEFPTPGTDGLVSIHGEGLLLLPRDGRHVADVVALPDADHTPEQLVGLAEGIHEESQFARRLAESGCRVIVPVLISREYKARNGRAKMTHREYIYRTSFELGRHLIGYELQKVLACIDWFEREADEEKRDAKIGVMGYGEGGMLTLYAAALDTRIDTACVSGYLRSIANPIYAAPLDRNVFGFWKEFDDEFLTGMIAPRQLINDAARQIELELPSEGGAPAKLVDRGDFARMSLDEELIAALRPVREKFDFKVKNVIAASDFDEQDDAPFGTSIATDALLDGLRVDRDGKEAPEVRALFPLPNPRLRQERQLAELDRHNQALLAESPYVRKERFWNKLDYSSAEAFEKSVAPFREEFKHDVIGHFDDKALPFNPRTRKAYDEEKWVGYEVMLDLWPDVFCYGILCLPKDMKRDGSERRPIVVCQHGLEGRPQDVVTGDHRAYHDFASKLCERGFITFAPQNLYIGRDKFRTLQRKANPLGKTLFSIITPQHQQILDWLQTLPYVDGERIGFYGLSYGGKTAMRVPPLVDDYKCVICSADFNDWVWKNASTRSPYSYVWTGEYEIFEWNLAHTFNYAEMAALIAPRPFMVERGHFDGVAPDERVASEFAKVRQLYNARLKLPADHCQIEWFAGPHTINGKGTFKFLHQHLNWPEPDETTSEN